MSVGSECAFRAAPSLPKKELRFQETTHDVDNMTRTT